MIIPFQYLSYLKQKVNDLVVSREKNERLITREKGLISHVFNPRASCRTFRMLH